MGILLVMAASVEGQVAALSEIVERHHSTQVLWAGPSQGSRSARRLQEALAKMGSEPLPATAG